MRTALIIVDVQNDFLPGGALGVPNGDEVVEPINRVMHVGDYDYIVASKDYHPANHCSFSDNPLYVDKSWPPHCVVGTTGTNFAPGLTTKFDNIVFKGSNPDLEAYSAFDGTTPYGVYLNALLVNNAIGAVDVVGLALDYCVKATAIDARRHGFKTRVILDATRPVAPKTGYLAVAEMSQEGVDFV